jgi:hypothetical protein
MEIYCSFNTYDHVSGHQDRHRLWWQCSQVEQLYCICDGLVKVMVTRSMMNVILYRDKYLLPLKHAAVYVGNTRSTTNMSL